MLAKIAGIQPSITSPGTNVETRNNITALITKANNPKVTIFNGAVTNARIGFIKVFTTPKTTAAKTAVVKLSTLNPGTMYVVAIKATAFNAKAIIICIFLSPPFRVEPYSNHVLKKELCQPRSVNMNVVNFWYTIS